MGDDWTKTIERIGQESRERQQERERVMREALPLRIAELPNMTSEELVDSFAHYTSQNPFYPKERQCYEELAAAAKTELLKRLTTPVIEGVRESVSNLKAPDAALEAAELLQGATISLYTEKSDDGDTHYVQIAFTERDEAERLLTLLEVE